MVLTHCGSGNHIPDQTYSQCRLLMDVVKDHTDSDIALLCRSRLDSATCSTFLTSLGGKPWDSGKIDLLCKSYKERIIGESSLPDVIWNGIRDLQAKSTGAVVLADVLLDTSEQVNPLDSALLLKPGNLSYAIRLSGKLNNASKSVDIFTKEATTSLNKSFAAIEKLIEKAIDAANQVQALSWQAQIVATEHLSGMQEVQEALLESVNRIAGSAYKAEVSAERASGTVKQQLEQLALSLSELATMLAGMLTAGETSSTAPATTESWNPEKHLGYPGWSVWSDPLEQKWLSNTFRDWSLQDNLHSYFGWCLFASLCVVAFLLFSWIEVCNHSQTQRHRDSSEECCSDEEMLQVPLEEM